MKKLNEFDQTHDFFSTKKIDDIVMLKFNDNLLFSATDLHVKQPLFDYLVMISRSDEIKVVLLMGSPHKRGCEEYVEFYPKAFETEFGHYAIERLYNAVNQFILNIVALNKITVHVDSGKVISLFLNVSFACNYRIVANDTVFENPCLKLGLVPKGGGAFFLPKMLGASKALEILLSEEDISAQKALDLGIVDKLAPADELENAALETARAFARKPATTLSGVKRLLSYSMKDLAGFLQLENEVLLKIGTSKEFKKRIRECAPDGL